MYYSNASTHRAYPFSMYIWRCFISSKIFVFVFVFAHLSSCCSHVNLTFYSTLFVPSTFCKYSHFSFSNHYKQISIMFLGSFLFSVTVSIAQQIPKKNSSQKTVIIPLNVVIFSVPFSFQKLTYENCEFSGNCPTETRKTQQTGKSEAIKAFQFPAISFFSWLKCTQTHFFLIFFSSSSWKPPNDWLSFLFVVFIFLFFFAFENRVFSGSFR